MIKGILLIGALLALTYFGLDFMGYRIAKENLHYYAPEKKEDSEKNFVAQYLDQVKFNHKYHPLIARKKGVSAAEKMDKSSTEGLKSLLQVDKFDQMEKMKKQIKEISAKADTRDKVIEEAATVK